MLAHAKMHVPSPWALGFEIAGALESQPRLGRRREIRRTADQPRVMRRDSVQDFRRGIAPGDTLGIAGKPRDDDIPTIRQPPTLHPPQPIDKLGACLPE